MQYAFVQESDSGYYATSLSCRRSNRMLTWDSTPGLDTLIVEVPFGDDPAARMADEICPALNQRKPVAGRYIDVVPGVWVRFVPAAEKARNGGCPLRSEARTYAIFALRRDRETTFVSCARSDGMISPICQIPLELRVGIERVMREEGRFFKRRLVETDYWRLSFPTDISDDVGDGDLAYRVDGFQIPLARGVLERGTAYVKARRRLEMVSLSKGILLD